MSLLEIEHLYIGLDDKTLVHDVSLSINQGEIVGLVGESGSGKSLTCSSILNLLKNPLTIQKGSITFDGKQLNTLTSEQLDFYRGNEIAMIYQDALLSLDPVFTIENQMLEQILAHQKISKQEAIELASRNLLKMGFDDPKMILSKYPFELSGGQRQRIMIAMAICNKPKLLIADEPTTALDVTIQEEILEHLVHLSKEMNMAVLLVTHDMGVIAKVADRVAVMYAGEIVEEADVYTIFNHPYHPYTNALFDAVISFDQDPNLPLKSIPSQIQAKDYLNVGCRFYPRCPFKKEGCKNKQDLHVVEENHLLRCILK